ncbi:hypothetical protein [Streptomyces sp. SAI-170]|uniref:hypothetical protein n=1 Tax=Streptomyces sp. SAI-170 TaxID=3377729 RepID=UPI003C7E71A4
MRPEQLSYYAGAFDPLWVESLYLPVADGLRPGQTVALVDGPDFHREADPAEAARAYGERPRTRVYESLDVRSDGWWSLATLHLAGMLRRRVICTAYESQAGDSNLGAHDDAWLGLIVQMRGTKRWTIWPTRDHPPEDVVMRTGDVMILPQGMTHQVSTPEEPGHSLHLLFAVTDEPISSAPGPARSAAGAA